MKPRSVLPFIAFGCVIVLIIVSVAVFTNLPKKDTIDRPLVLESYLSLIDRYAEDFGSLRAAAQTSDPPAGLVYAKVSDYTGDGQEELVLISRDETVTVPQLEIYTPSSQGHELLYSAPCDIYDGTYYIFPLFKDSLSYLFHVENSSMNGNAYITYDVLQITKGGSERVFSFMQPTDPSLPHYVNGHEVSEGEYNSAYSQWVGDSTAVTLTGLSIGSLQSTIAGTKRYLEEECRIIQSDENTSDGDEPSSSAFTWEATVDAETAADIFLENTAVWLTYEEYEVLYPLSCGFVDIDLDGIPEMITSYISGTQSVTTDMYVYAMDPATRTVTKVARYYPASEYDRASLFFSEGQLLVSAEGLAPLYTCSLAGGYAAGAHVNKTGKTYLFSYEQGAAYLKPFKEVRTMSAAESLDGRETTTYMIYDDNGQARDCSSEDYDNAETSLNGSYIPYDYTTSAFELNQGDTPLRNVLIESFNGFSVDISDQGALPRDEESEKAKSVAAHSYAVHDYVTFGSYEQNANPADGAEPIEWQILELTDDTALIWSPKAIAAASYHSLNRVAWESSTVSVWLNDEFYNTAFSSDEQAAILTSDVPLYSGSSTQVSRTVSQKVFLLSHSEFLSLVSSSSRYIQPTPSTASSFYKSDTFCAIWLRAPGDRDDYASWVNDNGEACTMDDTVYAYENIRGLCPALRVKTAALSPV